MLESPFPGMDPYLEISPRWQVFHGWFVRKLAEQHQPRARELGCWIGVERVVLDPEQMRRYKQEYLVVRDVDQFQRVLATPRRRWELTLPARTCGRKVCGHENRR